jgi:TPR repeat protein
MSFKSISALLGAFVLAVVIWLAWPASEPAPSVTPADAEAPVGPASEQSAASPDALSQDSRGAPPSDAEPVDVAELEARAERGDPQAMLALARLLSDCARFEPLAPDERDEILADLYESGEDWLQRITGQEDLDSALVAAIETSEMLAARCGGHELPPINERRHRAVQWSERAALAGNTFAQLEWVTQFRVRWSNTRDIVRGAEQVRVERERARAYVQQGLAQREPYALFQQAISHIAGDPDQVNPARAYAYLRAWRQLGSPGPLLPTFAIPQAEARLQQQLQPQQLRWAEQEAERLVREFSR